MRCLKCNQLEVPVKMKCLAIFFAIMYISTVPEAHSTTTALRSGKHITSVNEAEIQQVNAQCWDLSQEELL